MRKVFVRFRCSLVNDNKWDFQSRADFTATWLSFTVWLLHHRLMTTMMSIFFIFCYALDYIAGSFNNYSNMLLCLQIASSVLSSQTMCPTINNVLCFDFSMHLITRLLSCAFSVYLSSKNLIDFWTYEKNSKVIVYHDQIDYHCLVFF